MASPLDAIRKAVATGFKGRLRKGRLYRRPALSVNALGDDIQGTPTVFPFDGAIDNYSEFTRANAGIPVTDVRLIIIAGSLATTPNMDDVVWIDGRWLKLGMRIETDPARAAYACQAFDVPPLDAI